MLSCRDCERYLFIFMVWFLHLHPILREELIKKTAPLGVVAHFRHDLYPSNTPVLLQQEIRQGEIHRKAFAAFTAASP